MTDTISAEKKIWGLRISWHHGDYLALTQAVVSVFAVLGAYGVVFKQESFQERRNRRTQLALRKGVTSLAQRANTLAKRIESTDLARELNGLGPRSSDVEEYRMSTRRRIQSMLTTLDQIPLSTAADANCVDVILYLRQGLSELDVLFRDCEIESGRPAGLAAARFIDARNHITLALQELGVVSITVFDAARGTFPGGCRRDNWSPHERSPIDGNG